jgi:predicted nuclease with TOPRIM domain
MSLVGKIFAVLAMIIAVFYTGITVALVSLQENYRQQFENEKALHANTKKAEEIKYTKLDNMRKQLEGERKTLTDEVSRLSGENGNLHQQWAEAQNAVRLAMNVIDDQKEELDRLGKSRTQIHNDFQAKTKENEKLQGEIAELKTTIEQKNTNINQLQQDLATAQKNFVHTEKELGKVVADLETAQSRLTRLRDTRPDIYQDLIDKVTLPPKSVVRGKVTAVDQKLGLVIINKGQRNDVQKGHAFIVFRGDKYIGKVVVDDVFPDVAAARYVADAMKEQVEVGDDVTTKLSFEF